MKAIRSLSALTFLLFLAGCAVGKDRPEAEKIATARFEFIKQHKFKESTDLYSPKFYEKTSRENWIKLTEKLHEKLGDMQSYTLMGWNYRKYAGTGLSGTFYELQYETIYDKYKAREILLVYKPIGGAEYKIIGHNINSEGLVLE